MANTKKSEKGTKIHEPAGGTGGTPRGGHPEMNQAAPELAQASAPEPTETAGPLTASLGDLARPAASNLEHINAQTTGSASLFSFRPAMNRKTTMAAALGVLGVGALAYLFSSSRSRKAA